MYLYYLTSICRGLVFPNDSHAQLRTNNCGWGTLANIAEIRKNFRYCSLEHILWQEKQGLSLLCAQICRPFLQPPQPIVAASSIWTLRRRNWWHITTVAAWHVSSKIKCCRILKMRICIFLLFRSDTVSPFFAHRVELSFLSENMEYTNFCA